MQSTLLSLICELRENCLNIENYGLGGYNRLCYALTLHRDKKYDDACNELAIAMRLGCNHWRIKWHMAHSAYEGGNYLLAEESLCSLLSEFPRFEEARSLLESTRKELKSPASLSNIGPHGHLALANQYQNEGKHTEAAREI